MIDLSKVAQKTAARKRAALANLDGQIRTHRAEADRLWQARSENKQASELRSEERAVTAGHPFDLFVTPSWLAEKIVDLGNDSDRGSALWCEPSAGTGRIVAAMYEAGKHPFAVEIAYNAAALLGKRWPDMTIFNDDFLSITPQADIFVMNPPFSNGQDIAHVRHAYNLTRDGGRVVSVMSEGAFYQSYNRAVEFRAWLDELDHYTEKLPGDTFRASGANVASRLVVIDK